MILTWLSMFVAQYIFVALKAFQQRNVAFNNYATVVPISVLMSASEVYVIAQVAHLGLQPATIVAILATGLGGGLGALSAMRLHNAMFPRV